MPSVGTLNLTVQSNAGAVGESLKTLAGALDRVKQAIPANGLGLNGIATEISSFVTQISRIKSASTVFKNIESLGVGLARITNTLKFSTESISKETDEFGKAISTINVQPLVDAIKEIKGAISDGFHIGQAGTQLKNIKEILKEDWNTSNAESAGTALKTIADGAKAFQGSQLGSVANNISKLAKAMVEYADAAEKLKSALGVTGAGASAVGDEFKKSSL